MGSFQESYRLALDNIGIVQGDYLADEYVDRVERSIEIAFDELKSEARRVSNVPQDFAKGNLAETWHAETFNVSAAARHQTDVFAEALTNNKTGEDILYGRLADQHLAELKYYGTGSATAKAISNPAYNAGGKVVPHDQLNDVLQEAHRQALRNQDIRPEVAHAYAHTAANASDRLTFGNVESLPLDEKGARSLNTALQSGNAHAEDLGLTVDSLIAWSDIVREAGSAALNAAAFSAALAASPYIAKAITQSVHSGRLDIDTLADGAKAALATSKLTALRAAIAASVTASCRTGYCGEAIKNISPAAVGIATAMVVKATSHSIQCVRGEISKRELASRCMHDSSALVGGLAGASMGQLLIPVPMLGALVGNMVGSTIGALAFHGAESVVLGICVESGWNFFGVVEQSYVVPENVLNQSGFDLIKIEKMNIPRINLSRIEPGRIEIKKNGITFLRRGVIGMSVVGYI